MREGIAPTLVASTGPNRLCNYDQSFEVICFLPEPNNTRGFMEYQANLPATRDPGAAGRANGGNGQRPVGPGPGDN